jgi:hypothetical protein
MLPAPSKSHYSIGNSIVINLIDAGHEVTVVQAFPSKGSTSNRQDIVVPELLEYSKSIFF